MRIVKAQLPKERRDEFAADMQTMTPRELCIKYGLSDKVCFDWRRKIKEKSSNAKSQEDPAA